MELIQKGYIGVLTPLTKINNRKNRPVRYALIGACFFFIFLMAYLYEMDKDYLYNESYFLAPVLRTIGQFDYVTRTWICGGLLILALCLGVESFKNKFEWNWYIMLLWGLFNFLYIMAGILHDIGDGFMLAQVFVAVLIPAYYIVWNQGGRLSDLYEILALSIVTLTLITCFINIVWFQVGEIHAVMPVEGTEPVQYGEVVKNTMLGGLRYMGLMPNPSRIAHFATIGALGSLYILLKKRPLYTAMGVLGYGMSLMMSVMSVSRASMISIMVATFAFTVFYYKKKLPLKRFLLIAVLILLTFLSSYNMVNRGGDVLHLFAVNTYTEESYAAEEPAEEDVDSTVSQRFNVEGTWNTITSGRIGIWSEYIKKLNMSGHDVSYSYPLKIINPDTGQAYYFSYPHNFALDSAYRTGIPVGIIIILLELIGVCFALMQLIKKGDPEMSFIFPVMGILVFFLTGNIDSVDHVFTRVIIFIFYLSFLPVFGHKFGVKDVVSRKDK